jgi:hypothetical protein
MNVFSKLLIIRNKSYKENPSTPLLHKRGARRLSDISLSLKGETAPLRVRVEVRV